MSDERRCLVIDRYPALRQGVRRVLADDYEVEEARDGRDALDVLTALGSFDVAVVEMERTKGGGVAGIPAIRALREAHPGLGIVAHGPRAERRAVGEAFDAGATAYVAKSSSVDALRSAVDAAANADAYVDPAAGMGDRGPALTGRQREILQHVADGHSTDAIARRLGVSAETIRTHTKAALARLNARDRAHAIAIALRMGLID